MIFVDTSVWVSYFRGGEPNLVRRLNELLDEDRCAISRPVRIELLMGLGRRRLPRFRKLISAVPVYDPSAETWERIESWVAAASRKGERFGLADLVIAAIAVENEGTRWSLDGDFRRMEKLEFVRCE